MAKIIVAGHVCLDITPVFSAEKVLPLQKIMVPGKLTQMKDITLSTGGVVANTGLALKFLGADVELMGKIGKDELGQIVYSRFQKYNAEKGLIVSKDSSTSYTIAIAPPGTDRIFLHNPGANDTFSLEDLDFGKIAEADLFHFGYPPLMKRTYAEDGRELIEMFRRIKETGTITSLDMAFVDEDSEAGKATGRRSFGTCCPMWTILFRVWKNSAPWSIRRDTRNGRREPAVRILPLCWILKKTLLPWRRKSWKWEPEIC